MRPLPMVDGMLETVVRALAKSDLFGALRPDQLRKVAHRGELLQCRHGERILVAGEPSSSFYLVLSGEVVVEGPSGEVGRLTPADVVGEMGVLLRKPRSANVRADGPTLVLRWADAVFDAMFERIPGFGLAVSRALARRLEATNQKVVT